MWGTRGAPQVVLLGPLLRLASRRARVPFHVPGEKDVVVNWPPAHKDARLALSCPAKREHEQAKEWTTCQRQ